MNCHDKTLLNLENYNIFQHYSSDEDFKLPLLPGGSLEIITTNLKERNPNLMNLNHVSNSPKTVLNREPA